MTNNETIVNDNMADNNIIQVPRLELFDSLDDMKSYLGKNMIKKVWGIYNEEQ